MKTSKYLTLEEMNILRKKFIPSRENYIICNIDEFVKTLHCVNNYRGRTYGTPDTVVLCSVCVYNPKNAGLSYELTDIDKVILKKR